ncbi:MAG TPA: hypothetical protein VKE92_00740 [Anaerolineales bacterium]|nr:hypothetical protein [Anaerolineales bacterium]
MTTAPNPKFSREIHEGARGKDVLAYKRALSRARPDLYKWDNFTNYAGPYFIDAAVKWKKSVGLPGNRVFGKLAHEKMEKTHRKGYPDQWAFDLKAIALLNEYYSDTHTSPDDRIRQAMVAAGFYWYSKKYEIAYSQFRPFWLGKPPMMPSKTDCSGFYTLCSYAGGAPDPNGRGYDHLGYTGTLQSRGHRVGSLADLKIGDAIFYGYTTSSSGAFPYGSPTHVAMYVGKGMVLSMGHYPMAYIDYNYRGINHYRHYTVT